MAAGVHGDHQSLWIDPTDGDYVLSGSDGGYQVSFDGGVNYHIWRNVVLSQFYQIFYDDRDPYWVCGGLQDNGNWCGPSRAKDGAILQDSWYTVSFGDGFYTVPVPGKPNIVYSNAQGGFFFVTDTNSGRARNIPPYPRMIGSMGAGHVPGQVPLQLGRADSYLAARSRRRLLGRQRAISQRRRVLQLRGDQPRPVECRARQAARFGR